MRQKGKVDRSQYLFDNRTLLALIIPLVIEQLLAVLVGMADSIMIASVGEAAVSGVSLVDQIMVLLINAFAALATGGAVVAGQFLGQKRTEDACRSATQLVWFVTICAIVITLIVYIGKYFILHVVFGQIEPDVMHHADIYLMIVSASIPFMALYNGGAAIFRVMGNSRVTMQVDYHEYHKCRRKCDSDLWFPSGSRRCCNPDTAIQDRGSADHYRSPL